MDTNTIHVELLADKVTLRFEGDLTVYTLNTFETQIASLPLDVSSVDIDLHALRYMDSAGAIFIDEIMQKCSDKSIRCKVLTENPKYLSTLELVHKKLSFCENSADDTKLSFIEKTGKIFYENYTGLVSFLNFFGMLFVSKFTLLADIKNFRYKELLFEINESAIKAIGIIALTSFLVGLVVAYQSAYQLKLYGANIFIVDMMGISILRELAPLMTAIVVAGRSGSSYTAQIGAMKITQEIDAMKTMGFDPFLFLVIPRILALGIMMPVLIFLADIMGIFGGMLVANLDLHITVDLFIDRFNEVIAAKHFFVGIIKGPFFAFLIATIAIYRGLKVKDDTQSIGINTTKSVVESIFAVIVCDAVFSIFFTNLGI